MTLKKMLHFKKITAEEQSHFEETSIVAATQTHSRRSQKRKHSEYQSDRGMVYDRCASKTEMLKIEKGRKYYDGSSKI